jgi:hypothetical protein
MMDDAVKNLKGHKIDLQPSVNQFMNDLDNLGVQVKWREGQGGNLEAYGDYSKADFQGLKAMENAMDTVLLRMSSGPGDRQLGVDAHDAHRLKMFLDEQINYGGETPGGLKGRGEMPLKKLRANVDKTLDDLFPDYNEINVIYSDTAQALNQFGDGVGKRINLDADSAETAVGTALRKITSNYNTRGDLLNSLKLLDETVAKHFDKQALIPQGAEMPPIRSADLNVKLSDLVGFQNNLDEMFGSHAGSSFQALTERGATRAVQTMYGDPATTAAGLIDDARKFKNRQTEEKAMLTLQQLLKDAPTPPYR